jgi:hypothetical protein
MKTKFTILLILLLLIGGCEKEDHPIKYKYSSPSNIQYKPIKSKLIAKLKLLKKKRGKVK